MEVENNSNFTRTRNDLIRYALSCHASQKPIRREGIRERVINDAFPSRDFKPLFNDANQQLQDIFGLSMVPLPVHFKTLNQADSKPQQAPSRWVLQSTLPDPARQLLGPLTSHEDHPEVGFVSVVLSLVLVSNMSLPVDQLALYVRKLGPPQQTRSRSRSRGSSSGGGSSSAFFTSDSQMESWARDSIHQLQKQGYLDKVTQSLHATQMTQQSEDADEHSVYTWGPRAKTEYQPKDLTQMIAQLAGVECTDEFVQKISRAYGRKI